MQPYPAEYLGPQANFEKAIQVCINYGWILRGLTEDESRFLERARASSLAVIVALDRTLLFATVQALCRLAHFVQAKKLSHYADLSLMSRF